MTALSGRLGPVDQGHDGLAHRVIVPRVADFADDAEAVHHEDAVGDA